MQLKHGGQTDVILDDLIRFLLLNVDSESEKDKLSFYAEIEDPFETDVRELFDDNQLLTGIETYEKTCPWKSTFYAVLLNSNQLLTIELSRDIEESYYCFELFKNGKDFIVSTEDNYVGNIIRLRNKRGVTTQGEGFYIIPDRSIQKTHINMLLRTVNLEQICLRSERLKRK